MNQRSLGITASLASTLLIVLVVGCSDDATSGDASVKADKAGLQDKSVKDGKVVPDSKPSLDSQPSLDSNTQADAKPKPDIQTSSDLKVIPDNKVAMDKTVPKDQSVVDAWAGACVGVKCTIQDDCCVCKARKGGTTVPVCPITTCKQNTCGSVYIKKPTPYCLKGHCLLSEAGTACKTDADCTRVDNCCDCLALPKGAGPPPCAIKTCIVNTCSGYGLTAAQPRCISGVCVLRFP